MTQNSLFLWGVINIITFMHTALVLWVTMLNYIMSTFGWWTILQVSTNYINCMGSLTYKRECKITQSSEGPLFKAKANSTCANVLTPQRIFMDTSTQQAHYIEEVCSHLVGTTCQFISLIITTFLKVHTSRAAGSKEFGIKKGAPRQAGTLLFLWCEKSRHTNYV